MNKSLSSLAVGMSLVSISASATGVGPTIAPNATAALSGAMRIAEGMARDAGLPPEKFIIAQAPPPPQSVPVTSPTKDELKAALTALIVAAKNEKDGYTGYVAETFSALEIKPPMSSISIASFQHQPAEDGGFRFFAFISYPGGENIEIDRYVKSEKRMYSYLLSLDGALLKSAKTRRTKEGYFADPLLISDAQSGYQELLSWWVQYYRVNLKGKEQITARN